MHQTIHGFRFEMLGIGWAVYQNGNRLGTTRKNGSRIRERSWTWRTVDGVEGRSGSRQASAEALLRRQA